MSAPQVSYPRNSLRIFVGVLVILFALRVILPSIKVPLALAFPLSALLTVAFVGLPIISFYFAAQSDWTPKRAGALLAVGILVQAASVICLRTALRGQEGFLAQFVDALGQTGLLIWSIGLGALLGSMIRDKNLLLPVSVFLAGFDAFLILSPTSLPRQIMSEAPQAFQAVAAKVPAVVPTAQGASIGPGAYIGPADFIFLGMFFVALHKFGMRSRETLRWMIPVLVLYLVVVLFLGEVNIGPIQLGMLPALVPIGLTILIVNAREFQMKQDEKLATWVVAFIALALAGFGFINAKRAQAQRPAPLPPAVGQGVPAPADSPAPASPDPLP
ncbi:MAG: hypothetical protein JST40_00410 [Armatimonadetes bacterium]|nr:hypothetical protein [Armatimonadota bacterium]